MNASRGILTMIVACAVTGAAWADWNPGDDHKMHFPQLPNLTETGMDVLNSPYQPDTGVQPYAKFLADDFVCTRTGPITDVHVWGSWLSDENPDVKKTFQVGIYSNIPEGPDGYSIPGELLWQARLQPKERVYERGVQEAFFDPNQFDPDVNDGIIGSDTIVWQYNFDIPAEEAWRQEEGKVYWLGLTLLPDVNGDGFVGDDEPNVWIDQVGNTYGWKTADPDLYPDDFAGTHFMDDAVWTDIDPAGPSFLPDQPFWRELRDPRTNHSLDLSFVITPEPTTMTLLGLGAACLIRRRRR